MQLNWEIDRDELYWKNLLPKKWRSIDTYEEQLAITEWTLLVRCLDVYNNTWEVKLLDIWGNNSTALLDLKSKLMTIKIPEEKIFVTKIDIEKVNQEWVNFLNWDIEDDAFLLELVETLWINSQSIIFMNQVSQYLWDKFKVIKFVVDFLLQKWWVFYFNLVPSTIYSWKNASWRINPYSIFFDELFKIWEENEWVTINKKYWENLPHLYMYEAIKDENNWTISMPWFRRIVEKAVNWVQLSAYNINERMSLDYLGLQLESKWKVQSTMKK